MGCARPLDSEHLKCVFSRISHYACLLRKFWQSVAFPDHFLVSKLHKKRGQVALLSDSSDHFLFCDAGENLHVYFDPYFPV